MTKPDNCCWVCGSQRASLWKARNLDRPLTPEDFKITDSNYGVTLTLYRCADCSFIFADHAETGELVALYERLVDATYEEGAENRSLQMRWLLQLGRSARPQARTLLEIGAGGGLLIREARGMGLDAAGVEPSHSLVEAAKRLGGVDLYQGTYPHPELEGRTFDLVYVVDVIEHVDDPVQLLADCAGALAPGGLLLVVTPDVSSVLARALGHKWWHFRLAHVGYFDSRSMAKAADRAGLRMQAERRVQWFFPVRYLAERLAVYLPVSGLNRLAERVGFLRWIYSRVVPLNLHDSSAYFFARKDGSAS